MATRAQSRRWAGGVIAAMLVGCGGTVVLEAGEQGGLEERSDRPTGGGGDATATNPDRGRENVNEPDENDSFPYVSHHFRQLGGALSDVITCPTFL